MNAKIKMCQYVIFIKLRKFDIADIKYFTVLDYLLTGYGESSDHESEESSDDDVSIGKRKGRTGSGTLYFFALFKEKQFLTCETVCSIFSGARKFCLAHGLRQLIGDTKINVRCLQTVLMN